MNVFRLVIRSLWHFRAMNLAVALGAAVATAVLTGALIVGDSVRGSLRDLATQRLGRVDHLLLANRFFNADLAQRLRSDPGFQERFDACYAGILLRGSVAMEHGDAVSPAQIAAMEGPWASVPPGTCILNTELADLLGPAGSTLRLSLPTADEAPKDAPLSRRSRSEVLSGARVKVARVAGEPGFETLFDPHGSQRPPRNLWMNVGDLQEAVDQPDQANVLFVSAKRRSSDAGSAEALNRLLHRAVTLEDYGLELTPTSQPDTSALISRGIYVNPLVDNVAQQVARELNLPLIRVSVYLANRVERLSDSTTRRQAIHYAIVAGIDGAAECPLAPDEIALNAWAAERLNARLGDRIRFTYYRRGADGALVETSTDIAGTTFRVARILPMQGLGADPSLTPAYKGLTDADSVADWDPPAGLSIDKTLITPDDEQYWKDHRAAPKLFISLDTAQRLWGASYGSVTSLRFSSSRAKEFADALCERVEPQSLGMAFRPIRAEHLAAASGHTPFEALFLAFSVFLIAAAVLLTAMLFRLNVEQRARQIGLLAAVGFTPSLQRRVFLIEGTLIAAAGGLLGAAGGIGYAWLMLAGLRTWWFDAVGTTALALHVQPRAPLIGFAIGFILALLAIIWAVRQVGKMPAPALLAGAWGASVAHSTRPSRAARFIALAAGVAGIAFLLAGLAGALAAQTAFVFAGMLLLPACIALALALLRPRRGTPAVTLPRLAWRNAARHPARSALTLGLIAAASFVLVAVASMRQSPPQDTHDRRAGTGGYQLLVQTDIPLPADPSTPAGRELLAVRDDASPLWTGARFMPMRAWAGQDASCLNLTRPASPTILAASPDFLARNAFTPARSIEIAGNPWTLLNHAHPDGAIPVIADDETAQYILQLGLGQTLPITDQSGRQQHLRLVATLKGSIFQGELIMGLEHFQKLFPLQSGFGVLLVEAPDQNLPALRRLLTTELSDYAATVDSTAERLARYANVANTYLSTFQTLGALGLMVGTIGLAVVLLRGLFERHAEMALLAALGFRLPQRILLVLIENGALLLLGLLIGAGCAVVSTLPAIARGGRSINLPQLAAMLAAVALTGMIGLVVAVWIGGRRITPADLRAE